MSDLEKSFRELSKTENVFMFVPNLIGYGRILLALLSFWFMPTNYVAAAWCYILSGYWIFHIWHLKIVCLDTNQLEKLEAAKAAWLVCLSLHSLTGRYWALLGLSGPLWALLSLSKPYVALHSLTLPYLALFCICTLTNPLLTNERTLRLIGLLSQPKKIK